MRLVFALLLLAACDEDTSVDPLAAEQLAPPPVVSVTGSCPGLTTVSLSNMTPGGNWGIAVSPNLAPGVAIPSGVCAGTALRVGPPTSLGASGTADAFGNDSFTVTLPMGACGFYIQPVDLATCSQGLFLQL